MPSLVLTIGQVLASLNIMKPEAKTMSLVAIEQA